MKQITIKTRAHTEFVDITTIVQRVARDLTDQDAVLTVFVPHTTAGITINEHADPTVVEDVETVLDDLVPWARNYRHIEGDSAAHVKAIMTGSSVQVLVEGGELQLGTWQGVFLCEFDGPRDRNLWFALNG